MPNSDAIEVTPENIPDLALGVAVSNLCGFGFDEGRVAPKLRHSRFKRSTGAGAAEEKQHGEGFVAQIGVRLAERALTLEVVGHLQNGLHLFLAEIQVADQVAASEIRLHLFNFSCLSYEGWNALWLCATNIRAAAG